MSGSKMSNSARRRLHGSLAGGLATLISSGLAAADTPLGPTNGNPLVPGYFADPCIRKFGDTFYLYVTPDGWGIGQGVPVIWTSKDFVNWTPHRTNWPATAEKWAPSVVFANGKYYMFNSVPCQIWVGVSNSPLGPWKNALGEGPLIRDQEPKGTITLDGELFQDTDGSSYLAYGTWWTPTIVKMKPDLLSFDGSPMQFFKKPGTQTPNGLIKDCMEAPYMLKRNGVYYLMYSDLFCGNSTYQVKYSTASTPFGPWTYGANNPILSTNLDNSVDGPGHHGLVSHEGKDYIIYHRHDNPHDPDGSHRQVAADLLQFGPNQTILPVHPTHRGVGYLAPSTKRDTNWVVEPGAKVAAMASSSAGPDFAPENAADINNGTLWKADRYGVPQWLTIDLGGVRTVKRSEIDFQFPGLNYQYKVEYSRDGNAWLPFADRTATTEWRPAVDSTPKPVSGRYFRVTVLGDDHPERPNPEVGIWNVKLYDGVDKPFGAPRVTAGADLRCASDVPRVVLKGEVLDPGLPFTAAWKKVTGPGTVTFSDPSDPNATATFSKPGTYTLALVAKNRVKSAADEVKVTVLDTPSPALLSYDFEEVRDTVIRDSSGSSQDGTLASEGDVKNNPARTSGLFGRALLFDGLKSYVAIPGLGRQASLTAALWVKLDQLDECSLLSTADGLLRWGVGRDGHLQWTGSGDAKSETDLTTLGIGRWIHLAIQCEPRAGRMRFVINGKPEGWRPIAKAEALDLTSGLRLGGAGRLHVAGKIDQVRFFRDIVSEESLATLARAPMRPTLADALTKPDGTTVSLATMSVTYAPRRGDGQRASNWFVIADPESGESIVVRASGDTVEEGRGVTLTGQIQTDAASGTRYLRVSGPIEMESAPGIVPTPLPALPSGTGVRQAHLIRVSGTVREMSADRTRLTLTDASGQALTVQSESGPINRLVGVGNTVQVEGVLIRTGETVTLHMRSAQRTVPAVDPLEDGLLARFSFDGSANDAINADHPGTARNAAWVSGKFGQALELNGRDTDVDLPDMGTFRAVTIAGWVNPAELRPWQAIFHTNQFEPNRKLHLSLHANGSLLLSTSGNSPVDYSTGPVFDAGTVGTWKHLAVVYDSVTKQARIYANGELVGQIKYGSAGPIALTGGMRLASWGGGDRFFHGKLDDFRFYGRALSQDEVRRLMTSDGSGH